MSGDRKPLLDELSLADTEVVFIAYDAIRRCVGWVGDIPLIYKYTYLHHLNCISKVNMIATHAWASAIYPDIYSCAVTQIDMGVR